MTERARRALERLVPVLGLELFHLALEQPTGPKLLIRAEQDRLLADGQGHLWPTVAQQPRAGVQAIRVPRRGARPARRARLEVRVATVTLKPPTGKAGYGPVTLRAVLGQEVDPPDGIDPLSWMLLTTCAVTGFEDATEKLDWSGIPNGRALRSIIAPSRVAARSNNANWAVPTALKPAWRSIWWWPGASTT